MSVVLVVAAELVACLHVCVNVVVVVVGGGALTSLFLSHEGHK